MTETRCGRLAELLATEMEKQGVSIKDIAEKGDSTYEHARKIVRGLAYPSKHMLKSLADLLHLDRQELAKLSLEDRLRARYGGVSTVLAGRIPGLEPIEAVWPHLSETHQQELVEIARLFSRLDRHSQTKKRVG